MNKNKKEKITMKKALLILIAVIGFGLSANAQSTSGSCYIYNSLGQSIGQCSVRQNSDGSLLGSNTSNRDVIVNVEIYKYDCSRFNSIGSRTYTIRANSSNVRLDAFGSVRCEVVRNGVYSYEYYNFLLQLLNNAIYL